MADYAVRIHSSRGIVNYTPPRRTPLLEQSICPTHFRSRTRRSGSIQVLRYPTGYSPEKDAQTPRLKKLASKENAKRFLRSFILQTSSPPSSATPSSSTAPSSTPAPGQSDLSGRSRCSTMPSDLNRNSRQPKRTLPTGSITNGRASQSSSRNTSRTASPVPANHGGTLGSVLLQPLTNEKPIATGNSISVSISLAEPMLFLQGFEQNDIENRAPAMLRGSLVVRVTKCTKIKSIYLHFVGKSRTEWPEGIPPKRAEFFEELQIMHHTWPFFNAQFTTTNSGPCADYVRLHKQPSQSSDNLHAPPSLSSTLSNFARSASPLGTTSLEQKRLSLQLSQSRSFGKGESSTGQTVAQKGYRVFQPGDYVYNFELPLDSHLPETIDVDLGNVKYNLEVCIERAGAFRQNVTGTKEVTVIRAPAENSLEQVEPIAISRNWEDQLHYDIVISGKSFPLGSQIPIAFKLMPLAKVQCHRIKVLVTENIEYWANNKRVHRLEPTKKIQLFEKRSDGPTVSAYPGSTVRILAGGGVDFDSRAEAAAGNENVPMDNENNLLGNLEGQHNIGPTEMEFSVQLPSCTTMKDKKEKLHFDTTFHNIQVHHWIKIIMRLSKPDQNDPAKRRHFEISIDSPFHILSCQAAASFTALPAYGSTSQKGGETYVCGCPDAPRRPTNAHGVHTLSPLSNGAETHSRQSLSNVALQNTQRPIHMIRAPSYNPPAFDDDVPPPLITPPPHYDSIVSNQNPLADYFSRLAELDLDSLDEDGMTSPRSRVAVPLTPGGRVNRSMDERRTWTPIGEPA